MTVPFHSLLITLKRIPQVLRFIRVTFNEAINRRNERFARTETMKCQFLVPLAL